MTTAALVVEERSSVEFDDLAEECWPALIKNGVHHGGDLELLKSWTWAHSGKIQTVANFGISFLVKIKCHYVTERHFKYCLWSAYVWINLFFSRRVMLYISTTSHNVNSCRLCNILRLCKLRGARIDLMSWLAFSILQTLQDWLLSSCQKQMFRLFISTP